MPAITKAIVPAFDREDADGTAWYSGSYDGQWTIGSVPNGGYSLALVGHAAQHYMRQPSRFSSTAHVDMLHVTGLYLEATTVQVPFRVRIRVLKQGKSFSHLEGLLEQQHFRTQKYTSRLLVHLIMTNFRARHAPGSAAHDVSIPRSSRYHTPCPLRPPDECVPSRRYAESKFSMRDRMAVLADEGMSEVARREGRMEDGAWLLIGEDPAHGELRRPERQGVGTNIIPYILDMAPPTLTLVDPSEKWNPPPPYPTLSLSIEFKRPMPYDAILLRGGCYTTGRHCNRGQTETDCEVWSHPDDAELLGEEAGSGSHVIAIGRQVGVAFPLSFNLSMNKEKKPSGQGGEGSVPASPDAKGRGAKL